MKNLMMIAAVLGLTATTFAQEPTATPAKPAMHKKHKMHKAKMNASKPDSKTATMDNGMSKSDASKAKK